MSLEIRQMVVKSNVVRDESRGASDIERANELEAFKEELLEECRRLIHRQMTARGER